MAKTVLGPSPDDKLKKDDNSFAYEESSLENKNKLIFASGTFFSIFIVILTIIFYFFYIKNFYKKNEKGLEIKVTPTSVQVEEKKPVIDKSVWTFEVLNGTGVSGAASIAAKKLTDGGFTVVKIGNADHNYVTSELLVSTKMASVESALFPFVNDNFGISSSSGDVNGSTAAAEIIVGLK